MPREAGVHLAHGRAGPDANAIAAVEHLDAAEVLAGVDEDVAGRGLPRQARAARAERHRLPRRVRVREQGGDLVDVGRCHDRARGQEVVRGVDGGDDPVERADRDRALAGERAGDAPPEGGLIAQIRP